MPTPTDGPSAGGGRSVLGVISLACGIEGVLLLHVLFPDVSGTLGVVAILVGIPALSGKRSTRSRLTAGLGVLIGLVLLVFVAVTVITHHWQRDEHRWRYDAKATRLMTRIVVSPTDRVQRAARSC
jgi:hypothetical protein